MPTTAEMVIILEAQDRASAQLRSLGGDVARLEKQVDSASGGFARMGGAIGKLGALGLAAGGIGAIVDSVRGAAGFLGGLVEQASDLNEQLSRSQAIFGEAAQSVQRFATTTGASLGISQREALQAAGNFGQLFKTAGLGEDAAGDMSTSLVRLAADLASFNNIDVGDALDKLRSGLVGEAEPLRTLGVLLSEEAVKAEALASGIATSAAALTEAQKVQARYSLILRQTATAQGDFQRTSTGLANAQRVLRAAFADIQSEIGQQLLPTVAAAVATLARELPAALDVARRYLAEAAQFWRSVIGGDFKGALDSLLALVGQVRERLGPVLATWGDAFGAWVQDATPRLLAELAELGGALWAWIRAQAPGFLERLIDTWVPAFVGWVVEVTPRALAALNTFLGDLGKWVAEVGAPEMLALGKDLGAALARGIGNALEGLFVPTGATGSALATRARLDQLGELLDRLPAASPPLAIGPAGANGSGIHVNVVVGGEAVGPAELARRVAAAVERKVYDTLTGTATATDPGASPQLQGAGR